MELYESYFKEDATKFEQFKNDTGLLNLDENQFATALERLEDLLTIFDIAPEQVKEIGVLLTKLKDESLTDDEENYFYKMIGDYFKESYTLKRYSRRFKENNKPENENIILMPLIATFIKNGFLAKMSVANQEDFERVKEQIIDKKGDITKLVTDNPSEGIKLVNSGLVDGLKGSSYINTPIADVLPEDDPKNTPLEQSEWFSTYANDEILNSLAQKVEDNKFEFDLSLPAPESNEEGLEADTSGEEGDLQIDDDVEGLDDLDSAFEDEAPEPPPVGGGGGSSTPPPETPEEAPEEPPEENVEI